MTRCEFFDLLDQLRGGALGDVVSWSDWFQNSPSFDEDYKWERMPAAHREHLEQRVRAAVPVVSELADLLESALYGSFWREPLPAMPPHEG